MGNSTSQQAQLEVVTVTLNPAIDQTVVIPHFAAGQVNRVEHTMSQPGGKGVNVATFLADYGHRVGVTGFLGRENDGTFETLFHQKQINDRFVRIAGQTRIGIKITDPAQHQTTDINFPGQPPTTSDLESLFDQLMALESSWVVLAGSIPPAVDSRIYCDLITMLKKQGRIVVLDTSGSGLQHAVREAPQIIKPNIHELELLVGQSLPNKTAIIGAARELLAQGIQLVVVSMGKEGAYFVRNDATVLAYPPEVTVTSTVGAGDAMVAGLVAAHLRGFSLDICARLATAFSMNRVTHTGVGLTSPPSIVQLMEAVYVEEQ